MKRLHIYRRGGETVHVFARVSTFSNENGISVLIDVTSVMPEI